VLLIYKILDWSEVWALLIPLAVLWKHKKQPRFFKPIILYVWLALLIDIPIDLAYIFKQSMPSWMWPNNYLYNIHSIVRFTCFGAFFILLNQPYLVKIKKLLPVISFACILVNFLFFENFFTPNTFSSRLLATEAGILLFYCLQYYLFRLQEDNAGSKKGNDFWMVTGLSIYVVFNFPFFLLYTSLDIKDQVNWWYIHNVSYIILCIFIAKAFYVPRNRY
jgi:hypothetical protein